MTQPSSSQLEKMLHKFCRSLFQGSSLQEVIIGLGNAWVQNRQQAITTKNVPHLCVLCDEKVPHDWIIVSYFNIMLIYPIATLM